MPPGRSTRDVRESILACGRLERLTLGAGLVAFITLQHRRDVGARRDLAAIGIPGHEQADGAIRGLEVFARRAVHGLRGRSAHAIAIEEQHAPIADRRPAAQLDRDALRVVHLLLEARHRLTANALDFLARDGVRRERIDRRDHGLTCRFERLLLRHHREEDEHAGVAQLHLVHGDLRGKPRLDERFVEAPRGHVAQDLGGDLQRHEVLVRAGRHVIAGHEDLHVADATYDDLALAVLRRLDRVVVGELARRPRNRAQVLRDELQRALLLEAAGDDEHGVIRLIVTLVERP